MWSKGFCLLSLWAFSVTAIAIPNADLISNLQSRLQVSPKGGKLIKSFSHHTQSYIYDQALAIIALTKHGDQKNARALLEGLKNLQHKDGSLYFSYYMNAESPYPIEGDKRYAGAIAWVAMAAITYQKEFKTKEFLAFNHKVLKYLISQMKPIEVDGKNTFAITFGPSDLKGTAWNENETLALEHNLDAYSAFSKFLELNPHQKWNKHVTHLHDFIVGMWDSSRSHFWSGANTKTHQINKQELYLDNQTWSLLALDAKTIKKLDTKDALSLNCDNFLVEHEGVTGFMDSKPTRRPASTKFVWSEGTAGQILAMQKYNELNSASLSCNKIEAQGFLKNIKKMKQPDGGIAYATTTTNPDFTTSSSVAGTAWYYFAANNINPFDL
jgi:hypothetical protein